MDLIYRFFGIWMVFVINIAAGVEGAAYGEDCSSAACDDKNNICDTGKTDLCICDTGFFLKTSAAECAAQVDLNKVCEVAQTASDQCSIANSECRDDSGTDKCLCKTTHYENGGACVLKIAALEDSCVVSDPAPDQCAVDNAECRTAKCQCKVTHYVNVAACAIRKSPKASCASGECVTHASCDSGTSKCVCDAGYDPSPTISPTMCSGVVKVITQAYMYLVPFLVSMMLLLR